MEEERYTVSQVEKLTGIKGHVLRYWEEELELAIGRNAMGHRCYTRYDVQMFLNIKELKNRGLQLRAIRELVPQISRKGPGAPGSRVKLLETEEAPAEVREPEEAPEEAGELPEDERREQRMEEFRKILERLIRQCMLEKNHEERRCRSLDEAIRMHQESRKQAAVSGERQRGIRRKLRRKKKQARQRA